MPRDVARASLYRGMINLWVEDELTRAYLSVVWNDDPAVAFFIAGGNEGVHAIVKDAENAGLPNVFGLIDRDFRPTNRDHWLTPGKSFRTFVLPVHEIENYLLDPPALAACNLNNLKLSESQIEDRLVATAERLTWWAACRDVIAELKHRFRNGFIADPPQTIADEEAAAKHICASAWFSKLPRESSRSAEPDVRQLLAEAYTNASACVSSGRWRVEFAGKEVYRDIGSRICDQNRLHGYRPTPNDFDIDLAKDIAAKQAATLRVPADLTDLILALRSRIASSPSKP